MVAVLRDANSYFCISPLGGRIWRQQMYLFQDNLVPYLVWREGLNGEVFSMAKKCVEFLQRFFLGYGRELDFSLVNPWTSKRKPKRKKCVLRQERGSEMC